MTFENWWATLTTREKARMVRDDVAEAWAAATAAEREACAALCEEIVQHPAGYGGQWEGYGQVKTHRDGKACAAAIRERSNAKVRGDAPLYGAASLSTAGLAGTDEAKKGGGDGVRD